MTKKENEDNENNERNCIIDEMILKFNRNKIQLIHGCIKLFEQDLKNKLCAMFHFDTIPDEKPFLPKRWDSLFDNEAGSDVVFLVGTEPDTWRFPGHRTILRNNPVFKAMLEGPFAKVESQIVIPDVDGRAFDHLLRYLYHEEVQLQSVATALSTLYAANEYLCPELVDLCVRYLDKHLNTETVLQIYQHLRHYATNFNAAPIENDFLTFPTAPLLQEFEKAEVTAKISTINDIEIDSYGKRISQCCNSLLFNCYQYIDLHADEVLGEESVEDLTKDELFDIIKRDSLGISSERVLFSVIEKWCNRECKRCQLELSDENRKSIIGDRLLFSVRYLLMTSVEFLSGPMQSGFFDQTETAFILGYILKHSVIDDGCADGISNRVTSQVVTYLKRVREKKPYVPIPLSTRTKRKVTSELKSQASKLVAKKEKKKKKVDNKGGESKCLNYTLNVLAAIFD